MKRGTWAGSTGTLRCVTVAFNYCKECKKAEIEHNCSFKGGDMRRTSVSATRPRSERLTMPPAFQVGGGRTLQRWRYNWPGIGCES